MSDNKRNCKNCACYLEVTLSPLAPPQPQCRRNGPVPAQIRVERPRVLDGKPVMDRKTGKPITETSVENVFLHAPTHPDFVCFDGWRPIGTKPGRPFTNEELRDDSSCETLSRLYPSTDSHS